MRPLYTLPLQPSYTYTIQRGHEVLVVTISTVVRPTPRLLETRIPSGVLSLCSWLVGAVLLFFARPNNVQALRAGTVFLLGTVVLIGIQAGLEGVPGAWVGGHVLVFYFPLGFLYLGTLPRTGPLDPRWGRAWRWLLLPATLLALAGVYETLVLFPQPTSFQELVGVSLYSLGLLLAALGLVALVVMLAWRAWRLPPGSYVRQQLLILLAFIGLGILPAALLTVIPRALFDQVLLPFPAAITLMLLIPAGYLFVIFRRGLLGLDLFFGHLLRLLLLFLLVYAFYAGGLLLLGRGLGLPAGSAAGGPAGLGLAALTIFFLPALVLAVSINRPIGDAVHRLIYGRPTLDQAALARFAGALATRPEPATLAGIVTELANALGAEQALLALRDAPGRLAPTVCFGPALARDSIPTLAVPGARALRAEARSAAAGLFAALPWAELLLPLTARGETVGLLALARPGPDAYYNAWQVDFLGQAADVLAVGGDNIQLFAAARALSEQLRVVREQERRRLSLQIHDEPLQRVAYVVNMLDQALAGRAAPRLAASLDEVTGQLRLAAQMLRDICVGLYSPIQDHGVALAAGEIVARFADEHSLAVTLDAALPDDPPALYAPTLTTAVSHILTEALNNAIKHAPGATARVALACPAPDRLRLTVDDDGNSTVRNPQSAIGPPPYTLSYSELLRRGHLGLVGMHEWAHSAGGELVVTPREPAGTRVVFTCPL